jgi:hypothetical protein
LDLAYAELVAQGVLLERPEEPTLSQPVPQPASVVPVVAAPAPQATPVAAPAAKTGALPDARQVRPADRPSSSTGMQPQRRSDSLPKPATAPSLSAEEYNNMSAAEVKRRYNREPDFHAAVDALIASGKI